MAHNPDLCSRGGSSDEGDDNAADETLIKGNDSFWGARWPLQRLTAIGTDIRGQRRMHVLEVFLVLCRVESTPFICYYLQKLLKVVLSVKNTSTGPDDSLLQRLQEKADDLLRLLEGKVEASVFITAIGKVHQQITGKKIDRKMAMAQLAVADPTAYATKKVICIMILNLY
jgi:hypothetical protein